LFNVFFNDVESFFFELLDDAFGHDRTDALDQPTSSSVSAICRHLTIIYSYQRCPGGHQYRRRRYCLFSFIAGSMSPLRVPTDRPLERGESHAGINRNAVLHRGADRVPPVS
jgi:hypothetical protein